MTTTEVKGGSLANVRVLDLSDDRAIYAGKLLGDLGAEIVRLEPAGGDPLRERAPFHHQSGASLWHAFFASSRRFLSTDDDAADIRVLVAEADVVLDCGRLAASGLSAEALVAETPALIVVDVSSFGPDGPWADYLAPGLVAEALGGIAATSGDADTPPLKLYGDQYAFVGGVYAAIGALSALRHARETGEGQVVRLSVHEALTTVLEHVLMWVWFNDILPMADGPVLPRQGSLHWTSAYVVMQALGGSIMITPTPDFQKQLAWLIEEGVGLDLLDEKYSQPENLTLLVARTMEVLREWVGTKDVEAFFHEAQGKHHPYGWVMTVPEVARNPQLAAREWWAEYDAGGATALGPGAPYHFSETPWRVADPLLPTASPPAERGESRMVVADPSAKREESDEAGPLEGLRILDFTHVLAGPFATRVLGDMGADVVKIMTATRASLAGGPTHPYHVMWNRNKRVLQLDLTRPEAREIARALALKADIVIDNFSVGVLDRWGLGYESVAEQNPGVTYVGMSGMGVTGPWSSYVTYAPTVHALAGLTYLTGVPGRNDIGIGFSYNDHMAGLHGTVAVLAALEGRRATGRGQHVDLSQFEVGVNFSGVALLDWFANGVAAEPVGNDPPWERWAPHACYPCAGDDEWVAIAVVSDEQWHLLCEVLDASTWAADGQLATSEGRWERRAELDAGIAAWTSERDRYDVMETLQAAGVPAGVVQTGADMTERDPQLRHGGMYFTFEDRHPVLGTLQGDRLPLRFVGTPVPEYRRTEDFGESNESIAADWLGLSADEVARLQADGVIE